MTQHSKKVLFVLTSNADLGGDGSTGYYINEAAHPWKVLTRAGHQVDFASFAGGPPPQDGRQPGDQDQEEFLADPRVSIQLADTPALADVDADAYDAVLYVGGHGTMWDFPASEAVSRLGRDIYENGGVVAAVCHGPAALVNLTLSDGRHLVDGKRVASFTNAEEEAVGLTGTVPFALADRLSERGADHVPADNFTENVVVDGRLVTGQNPQSATGRGGQGTRGHACGPLAGPTSRIELPARHGVPLRRPVTPARLRARQRVELTTGPVGVR
ncbi:MAG: type 1 glutamine amidotransferase domain-containing protein [Bifidobacteriaceae bacterium]|jgi:putative intracellular protease/amidase|nr:type 1 glutamine amidotransferase domain-containing protein [Bifidobacteriaceae bacterium]